MFLEMGNKLVLDLLRVDLDEWTYNINEEAKLIITNKISFLSH